MNDQHVRALEGAFKSNVRYFQIMREHHERRGIGLEPEMKRILTSVRGGAVLDLGCGEGSILNWLSTLALNDEYVGIDISPIGVRMARSRATSDRVRYLLGNIKQLPFADGHFSLIYAQSVLEHVSDHRAVIEECTRVLEPGGVLAIRLPNGAREGVGAARAALRHITRQNGVRALRPSLTLARDEDSVTNFDACHIPSEILVDELRRAGLEIDYFTTRLEMVRAHGRSWFDRLVRRVATSLPVYPIRHLGPTTIVSARRPGAANVVGFEPEALARAA